MIKYHSSKEADVFEIASQSIQLTEIGTVWRKKQSGLWFCLWSCKMICDQDTEPLYCEFPRVRHLNSLLSSSHQPFFSATKLVGLEGLEGMTCECLRMTLGEEEMERRLLSCSLNLTEKQMQTGRCCALHPDCLWHVGMAQSCAGGSSDWTLGKIFLTFSVLNTPDTIQSELKGRVLYNFHKYMQITENKFVQMSFYNSCFILLT